MSVQYKIIEDAVIEPVTLDEATTHLRTTLGEFNVTDETELIENLIKATREYCESYTGLSIVLKTYVSFPSHEACHRVFELPKPPLNSVLSFTYKEVNGVEIALTEGIDYFVDKDNMPGRIVFPDRNPIYGKDLYYVNPIKIQFKAGYDYDKIPSCIKQAMLLLIGHWYTNREAVGDAKGEIDFAVKALLSQHRIRWF